MPLEPNPNPISAPTPAPVLQPSDASLPPAASTEQPQTVTIAIDQLQQFAQIQSRLAQLESEQRQRDEAASAEQARLLAAKGQVEEALRAIQTQSEAKLRTEAEARLRVEERAKRYALDNELSKALAMHPILPGTTEQLAMILRGQLQVQEEGDKYVVRTPTYVAAADHIAAMLARPDFAHFLRPQSTGGTAGTGATQAEPTPPANRTPDALPKTMGEAIILQIQAQQAAKGSQDVRTDMSQSFGLGKLGRPARVG
jgi:hypothetical protein